MYYASPPHLAPKKVEKSGTNSGLRMLPAPRMFARILAKIIIIGTSLPNRPERPRRIVQALRWCPPLARPCRTGLRPVAGPPRTLQVPRANLENHKPTSQSAIQVGSRALFSTKEDIEKREWLRSPAKPSEPPRAKPNRAAPVGNHQRGAVVPASLRTLQRARRTQRRVGR
jgi:hypothetical protein